MVGSRCTPKPILNAGSIGRSAPHDSRTQMTTRLLRGRHDMVQWGGRPLPFVFGFGIDAHCRGSGGVAASHGPQVRLPKSFWEPWRRPPSYSCSGARLEVATVTTP